jgi:protein SCO1
MNPLPILAVCILSAGSLSVNAMAAAEVAGDHHHDMPGMDSVPGDSLYQLSTVLEVANGSTIKLAELRGKPLLVTMFYSHCSSVCPLLTAQVQRLVNSLPSAERQQILILMVSFDSLRDTPAALTDFKAEHHIHDANWIIARAPAGDVRTLAATLGIRYRELPDHTFNHSAIISVTDRDGTVRARTSAIGVPDDTFVRALRAQIAAPSRQNPR